MNTSVGYNGNSFLKKAGVQQQFTKEQVQEYIKCAEDPVYFIRNYAKIITLDDGLQYFDLYSYQERMIETFASNRFIVNLLPRQMGKTQCVAAFILHYVIFTPEKSVGILANKAATAREILSRVQRMYENLPLWLQPGIKEWNKGNVVLGNDSIIMASATSSSSVRGFSFNMILLDEFAHVEQQHDFWESTYPVVSSGDTSKVIIISTPNGLDLFYRIYNDAVEGRNRFVPVTVHWAEHPKRDEAWRDLTLANIGDERFAQEFGNEFLGSSGTLIAGWKLKELAYSEPLEERNNLKMFERPVANHRYIITVDVSRGKGLDYSAFQVIDITEMPYRQVAVFRNNMITPSEYAFIVNSIGRSYNEASILVEINDIGEQVSSILHDDVEYENLLFTENAGRGGKRLVAGFGSSKCDKGIRTTKTVKSIGCSVLKLLVEQNQLIINDFDTIQELSTFSKKGTSWEAESGCNDDMVMCLVLFAWLSSQRFFKELTDINTINQLRDKNEEQLMNELTPFGAINTGHDAHEEAPPISAKGDDLGWLLQDETW